MLEILSMNYSSCFSGLRAFFLNIMDFILCHSFLFTQNSSNLYSHICMLWNFVLMLETQVRLLLLGFYLRLKQSLKTYCCNIIACLMLIAQYYCFYDFQGKNHVVKIIAFMQFFESLQLIIITVIFIVVAGKRIKYSREDKLSSLHD